MAAELDIIHEYEGIIRSMKEQIAVLKEKVNSSSSRGLESTARLGDKKEAETKQYQLQVKQLSADVRALAEANRKLKAELTSYQLGVSQSARVERSQLQEKLLESELQRMKAQEQAKTLTSILHELHEPHRTATFTDFVGGDFDKDVEVYLQTKDGKNAGALQKKLASLEGENRELRERVVVLEGEMKHAQERLQVLATKSRNEGLEREVESLQKLLAEKEGKITHLLGGVGKKPDLELTKMQLEAYKEKLKQTSTNHKTGVHSELSSPRNPIYPEVRTDLARNQSPRSSSVQHKLSSVRQPVPPPSTHRSSSQLSFSSGDVSSDLSSRHESLLERYQRKWNSQRPASIESQQLSAIKEQLGATQKQLVQLVSRPATVKPRSSAPSRSQSSLLHQLKVKRPR